MRVPPWPALVVGCCLGPVSAPLPHRNLLSRAGLPIAPGSGDRGPERAARGEPFCEPRGATQGSSGCLGEQGATADHHHRTTGSGEGGVDELAREEWQVGLGEDEAGALELAPL